MRLSEKWGPLVRSNLLWGGTALLAGVAAFVLARHYLGAQARELELRYAQQLQTRTVLVAARAMARDEQVGQAQLARRDVPLRYLPADAVGPDEAAQMIGRRLLHPVAAGQALADTDLAPRQPTSLAGLLPPGQRAVTVAVDEVAGQAGLLRAGDQVDLYWHGNAGNGAAAQVRRLLQDVPVLARGTRLAGSTQPGTVEGADTFTLQVSPDDAARIVLAQHAGQLVLVPRPPGDVVAGSLQVQHLNQLLKGAASATGRPRPPDPPLQVIVGGAGTVLASEQLVPPASEPAGRVFQTGVQP